MRVHLDERKSTVGLEAGFGDISKILEQRDQVRLRSVWRQVANIARGLPLWSLSNDHIIALYAVGGEVMVSERRGRCHAHGGHGRLLGNGWLALLVGPIAANGTRSKPLAVHGGKRTLSIGTVPKCNETVATGPSGLHIPHDSGFRDGPKCGESLKKDLIVDLVGQVTDEDVEVVGRVLFRGVVRLISPVDTDFLSESDCATVSTQHARLRCCGCDGR